ncbi:auxin response factor [Musa troglodytarum]|uniref:Auxin response factor n=1 Tax=Musa troglodytarum TaxID=320322 RepID=A0A9E7K533_9LILI|nr:auxin response factor [Musa troglodytarum]
MKRPANGAAAHEGEFGLGWLPCPCLPPACGLFDACVVDGDGSVERKTINPELWHACAGPLVTLPLVGSLVVYFPQGHSEQVATSMQKDIDAHIPNYTSLPSKLICLLHNVTLHVDPETDEVYAQMTLQPVNSIYGLCFIHKVLWLKHYIYIYIYTHTHTQIYTHISIYTHMYIYIHTYIHIVYIYTHTHMHTYEKEDDADNSSYFFILF